MQNINKERRENKEGKNFGKDNSNNLKSTTESPSKNLSRSKTVKPNQRLSQENKPVFNQQNYNSAELNYVIEKLKNYHGILADTKEQELKFQSQERTGKFLSNIKNRKKIIIK